MDQVRRQAQQDLALAHVGAHQAEVEHLQVAQAAVDQAGRPRGRARGRDRAARPAPTLRPRRARSRAMPVPTMPPPTTSTSSGPRSSAAKRLVALLEVTVTGSAHCERERQQVAATGTRPAVDQDRRVRREVFGDDLAARATRHAPALAGVQARDGQCRERAAGPGRDGGEDGDCARRKWSGRSWRTRHCSRQRRCRGASGAAAPTRKREYGA